MNNLRLPMLKQFNALVIVFINYLLNRVNIHFFNILSHQLRGIHALTAFTNSVRHCSTTLSLRTSRTRYADIVLNYRGRKTVIHRTIGTQILCRKINKVARQKLIETR